MIPRVMIEEYPKMDDELKKEFHGKTILVTGGTGSIGSRIAKGLRGCNAKAIRILSNDENGVFYLSNELEGGEGGYRFFVGDVRDKERLVRACENVDIVFHAAALKHVPLCEYNPSEAVKTNVIGTQNIIDACIEQNVEKMIFISTDKAVEPVNTMGATKLLAEKLVIDANYTKGNRKTCFSIVRFGNVMGSRGSVIPLFVEQCMNGGPITLTDPDMTRFMMYLHDAINLIFRASIIAEGGEIFTFDMPVARMSDIADAVRELVAPEINKTPEEIDIKIVGIRPGERLYESLMTDEEAQRAQKVGKLYKILPVKPDLPGMRDNGNNEPGVINGSHRSDTAKALTKDEVTKIIKSLIQYGEA